MVYLWAEKWLSRLEVLGEMDLGLDLHKVSACTKTVTTCEINFKNSRMH